MVHIPTPTATARPAISAAIVQTLWPVLAVVAAIALSLVEVEIIMTHTTGTLTLTVVIAGTALSVLAAVHVLSQILRLIAIASIAMASDGHGLKHIDIVVILSLLAFGALGATVLVLAHVVSATTIAHYGLWAVLILIALFMLVTGTKTKGGDIFVSFLLLLSIGGLGITYAIEKGYISNYTAALATLGAMFIILFIAYARAGYHRVRRR